MDPSLGIYEKFIHSIQGAFKFGNSLLSGISLHNITPISIGAPCIVRAQSIFFQVGLYYAKNKSSATICRTKPYMFTPPVVGRPHRLHAWTWCTPSEQGMWELEFHQYTWYNNSLFVSLFPLLWVLYMWKSILQTFSFLPK